MKNKTNLHFLLALGNQKVIVLKQNEQLQFYADASAGRKNISLYRLSDTLYTR